ncbi:MDR family MFS transporter [Paenibacillus arenosi]|uniref:MFS transporter n=1 Tax=Paenibacillus arenosi TaxID=2774142 RepID=A0ABR9B011_9BACL|nr:MDR family MFS transporter [Paenibacillus arenosi]MBD8499668.1 MFS transporter [Paenibacillus arenosi]
MNRTMIMASLMVATFLAAIEGTIVSTAMPKIAGDLQGFHMMSWVFTAYLLVSSVSVPIYGKLSDIWGRKAIFLTGIALFLIGSTLCGFAQTMEQLIWFRVIQGLGAGAILPVTNTIIADLYPYEQRAKILGYIGAVWGTAGIAGPLVGGFMVDQISWHWIFFMNIPFGVVAMILVAIYLKEEKRTNKQPLDFAGAITFTIAVTALLYGVHVGSETGEWLSISVLALFAVFIVFIIAFIRIEATVKDPIMPLQLFRNRAVAVTNVLSFIIHVLLIGIVVYVPLWMQGVAGSNATLSGLALAPMSITWTFGAFLCGKLMINRGMRTSSIIGGLFLFLSALALLFMQVDSNHWWLYVITAFIGIGFGISVTLHTVVVQSAISPDMIGTSVGTNVLFRNIGQTIGVSLIGSYFNVQTAQTIGSHPDNAGDITPAMLNTMIQPSQDSMSLSESVISVLRDSLASSIHVIFIILIVVAFSMVALSWGLPSRKQKSFEQEADSPTSA